MKKIKLNGEFDRGQLMNKIQELDEIEKENKFKENIDEFIKGDKFEKILKRMVGLGETGLMFEHEDILLQSKYAEKFLFFNFKEKGMDVSTKTKVVDFDVVLAPFVTPRYYKREKGNSSWIKVMLEGKPVFEYRFKMEVFWPMSSKTDPDMFHRNIRYPEYLVTDYELKRV